MTRILPLLVCLLIVPGCNWLGGGGRQGEGVPPARFDTADSGQDALFLPEPIIDALEIVSKTAGNYTIEGAIMYVREKISEGQNMVDPLMETGIFPNMVVQMIGVGESTGALDTMLNKIADFYEDEVDAAVENLTALLEPLMILLMGGIVFVIALAVLLPMLQMNTLAGG